MNFVLCFAALAAVCLAVESKRSPPKIQVYSQGPGEYGKENVLICHVSKFHPPDVSIVLMKNGVEIPGTKQTDLSFGKDWHFYLTKHVKFTPNKGEEYTCKVTHGENTSSHYWEPNM
ncbi:beta-2-microglobulin-like [Betta splendens]|uniref:Beta-2-microglobulin n=1 Tax=Betta splendens TaxID=158456 RepID=A0A6P7NFN9_BETSP|nr:beta-2-microglobulin-like [Betta splendens]